MDAHAPRRRNFPFLFIVCVFESFVPIGGRRGLADITIVTGMSLGPW